MFMTNWLRGFRRCIGVRRPRKRRRHLAHRQTIPSAVESLERRVLLADIGVNRRLNADGTWTAALDPIDRRILDDVANGTGPEYDSLPSTAAQAARGYVPANVDGGYLDTDVDGMPDVWERDHHFDKNDPIDGSADADRDGWTNVEEFLNGTNPRVAG